MKTPIFLKRLKYRSARNKLIPDIKTSNPIINDLVDLTLEYHYNYDTVYAVYAEWEKDIVATESTLISALYLGVDPLSITQDSVKRVREAIENYMISMSELENNLLKN